MRKLTRTEAMEARERGREYEHSIAIENNPLTPEEQQVFVALDRARMGYEQGVEFVLNWCRQDGLIRDRELELAE